MSLFMSRADADAWEGARTLADLGELTAQWLEGRIASQPGYATGCGPDPETAELIPVLAKINRAGFVTETSQPGFANLPGANGGSWSQRAAVEGYAEPVVAGPLAERAREAELNVALFKAPVRRLRRAEYEDFIVTLCDGQPRTGLASQPRKSQQRDRYGVTNALDEIRRAWQLTIASPDYAADTTLWDLLDEWADGRH